MTDGLADRLADRVLELVDVPSESREEAALAARVLAMLGDRGRDAGDTCVLAGVTERRDRPLVLLAGHLDTVPAQGNLPGARDDGWVTGLGAADMKAALGVMIELALDPPPAATVDVGYVFFGREELPFGDSALTPLLDREPGLRTADLVVVMEPTDNALHAGCVGNINATWTFRGTAGHSARPWLADNAIHRAAAGIAELAVLEPVDHVFAGLTFREVVSVVTVSGGVARNVVPDTCVAEINMRYAPGTSAADAEARLRALCEPHGELVIDGNAPSGAVPEANPLVDRLVAAGDLETAPKQAWTPVAEFAAAGVDAVNFGPGAPRFAHRRDERVAEASLVRSHAILQRFLCA
ncbi:succinyl-diaminopimelate desuccinylase [Baekduia soli]|uniref:Succinyl-diaminopimelate desuccinylase n=1 Tax=Baekduia soli TaxID=496014 RepID=A0A5B8U793_9ACTN|nr:succinyl-diaminopimelate desuccinylase [Baekduia soli]QEC48976.1 succinyl-diaminopimelate desuccinylase [Baekduia soli]